MQIIPRKFIVARGSSAENSKEKEVPKKWW